MASFRSIAIMASFFFVVSKTPTSTAISGIPHNLNQARFMAFAGDWLGDGNWACQAVVGKDATSGICYARTPSSTANIPLTLPNVEDEQ